MLALYGFLHRLQRFSEHNPVSHLHNQLWVTGLNKHNTITLNYYLSETVSPHADPESVHRVSDKKKGICSDMTINSINCIVNNSYNKVLIQ